MTSKEYLERSTVSLSEVRAWSEAVVLPTYEVGAEEKNPIFLEKRVYQGSSGSVYPYPVIEKISDKKTPKSYNALFIENEYIKVMVLPELGGRIQMAYDKVKQRHFVYFNQVIKPALVGLTGPWISGGIEFNWPQHHRPSTFKPTDFCIEEHPDGSKTIWCNEVERMFHTKGMQGFRLYPAKAYIEINVKVYNRTPFPQTFLWWANPAVVVHDDYHSVFPADVHAVFDHGKRDVSSFPIATGIYYKADYSEGVDISKYKNIPVPTSYMAIGSKYNFVGGYESNVEGGLLHVANHHVSPGKKQWTWGYSDFGRAWDRNLTDEDGPYIELMTGVYTDNQPDFSWLQPYEEKAWKQYFMPYSEVGYVKNASKDAIVNLLLDGDTARGIVYTTGVFRGARILLTDLSNKIWLEKTVDINPATPFTFEVKVGDTILEHLLLTVATEEGNELVAYQAEKAEAKSIPEPARAAKSPKDIESMEQLYLTGLHLEQYRHATYDPMDYYMEALNREIGDIRCNNALGLLLLRKGQFEQAEPYFRQAIDTLTERNPNPYDGEAYYNLGCCLKLQGKLDEAYGAFYKSAWNDAWQAAAYFSLAQLDCRKGDWEEALAHVDKALIKNWHNHKARQLKTSILRKLARTNQALKWAEDSLEIDTFNMACRFEYYLISQDRNELDYMKELIRGWEHAYIEYALDFMQAGLYAEAIEFLQCAITNPEKVYPMVYYTLGACHAQTGNVARAKECYALAAKMSPDYCFPNRLEEVNILRQAIQLLPKDSKATYYLGNFYYNARQYTEAIHYWEQSVAIDPTFPTVLRNLSLAAYNKQNNKEHALELMEKAFALDTSDARVLMELDQLYKRLGHSFQKRLDLLEKHLQLVEQRDDLCLERITLLNQLGRYEQARELLAIRKFHPWEGGEGKVTGQYIITYTELAKQALTKGNHQEALNLLLATVNYPENLGEGKLSTVEENDLHYHLGEVYEKLGNAEQAQAFYSQATVGTDEPTQAFYYNDQQPDKIFYQGLAWRALGNEAKAQVHFHKLIKHGEEHLSDTVKIDYFAVSLPDLAIWEDDLQKRNKIHCHYVMGLGHLGLGNKEKAETHFEQAATLDHNHQGVQLHREMLK